MNILLLGINIILLIRQRETAAGCVATIQRPQKRNVQYEEEESSFAIISR